MWEKYHRITESSIFSFCIFFLCFRFLGISNLISYAIFIIVLVGSYWILGSYQEKFAVSRKQYAQIVMHAFMATGVLIAFIGVSHSPFWIQGTLIVLSTQNPLTLSLEAIGVVIFYFLLKKISNKLSSWVFIIPLTILSIWLYISSYYFDLYHQGAIFISISRIVNGVPFSADMKSIYGHYAFFFKPLFDLIPFSRENFNILFAFLAGISYLNFSLVLNKLINDKFYKHLGIFLLFGFITLLPRAGWMYFAVIPLRVIFPSFLLLWAIYVPRNNCILYWLFGLLTCALSIIFSPETGIVCLISFIALYVYERSFFTSNIFHIAIECLGILLLGMLSALGIYNIFNISMGGGLQNIADLIFPLLIKQGNIRSLELPLALKEYFWILAIMIFACIILYALSKNPVFIKNKEQKVVSYDQNIGVLFIIAISGLFLFSYFINRAALGNGIIVAGHITILTIWILSSIKAPTQPEKIDEIFSQAFKNVGTIAIVFAIVSIFSDAIYSKKFHAYIAQKNQPAPLIEIHKKFIQEHIVDPEQTAGFGSDIWEYAFLSLGLKNQQLGISDYSNFWWIYVDNIIRPINILAEKKTKYLFVKTYSEGWFWSYPEFGEIFSQAIDSLLASSYKLVAEDTENDMRFYERIE